MGAGKCPGAAAHTCLTHYCLGCRFPHLDIASGKVCPLDHQRICRLALWRRPEARRQRDGQRLGNSESHCLPLRGGDGGGAHNRHATINIHAAPHAKGPSNARLALNRGSPLDLSRANKAGGAGNKEGSLCGGRRTIAVGRLLRGRWQGGARCHCEGGVVVIVHNSLNEDVAFNGLQKGKAGREGVRVVRRGKAALREGGPQGKKQARQAGSTIAAC